MRTEPDTQANQAVNGGRRASDRRGAGAPVTITDRREPDRRSGKDRRAAPRS